MRLIIEEANKEKKMNKYHKGAKEDSSSDTSDDEPEAPQMRSTNIVAVANPLTRNLAIYTEKNKR